MTPPLCIKFLSFSYICIIGQSWLLSPRTFKAHEVRCTWRQNHKWIEKWRRAREGEEIKDAYRSIHKKREKNTKLHLAFFKKNGGSVLFPTHKPLLFNEESVFQQWAQSAALYNIQLFSILPEHIWLIQSMLLTLGWSMGGSVTGWHRVTGCNVTGLHRDSAKSTNFKTDLL